MKKTKIVILTALIFSLGYYATAQTTLEILKPHFIGGFDWKMYNKGAGHDYGNESSFDYEIGFGVYTLKDGLRIQHLYKSHKKIGFEKFTLIKVDKYFETISNVNIFYGLETSVIRRTNLNTDYTDGNNYRRWKTDWFLFGGNMEINYKPKWSYVSLYLKGNFYQSETDLRKLKKFRKDVTIGIIINLFR